MSYNLDKEDEKRIIELAKKYRVEKVILFGSRARGNNRPDSDVDLALSGGNYFEFAFDFDDESNGNIRPTIKSQGRIL
ncbi:MAG: nucleotidyltransferase domain-containing protein [Selenomonadaceae bacterium]|nr:nucleotidyltransferase domain-containing protein [Selenomonadaceae bacterium]